MPHPAALPESPAARIARKFAQLLILSETKARALEIILDDAIEREMEALGRTRAVIMVPMKLVLLALTLCAAAACGEDRLTVPTPIPSQTIRTTVELCGDPHNAARGIVCP